MFYKRLVILSLSFLLISCGIFGFDDSDAGGVNDPYNLPSLPWDGKTINEPRYDEESRTYYVTDATHFAWIIKRPNDNDSITYDKDTIILVNDIDLDNKSMYGMAVFQGTLDGNNKAISNIYISIVYDKVGLIRRLLDNGTVKNLTIKNGSIKGKQSVGGIVGWAQNAKLINVRNSNVTVTGSEDQVGGIVGVADNVTIKFATNLSKVYGRGNGVGGIVGHATGLDITNSVNLGEISGDMSVGGIAGYGMDTSVSLSQNNGQLIRGLFAGGIIGACFRCEVENSSNLAKLMGRGSLGGIIGNVQEEIALMNTHSYGKLFPPSASVETVGKIIGKVDNNTHSVYVDNYYLGDGDLKAIGKPKSNDAGAEMDSKQYNNSYNFNQWDFNNIWVMQDKCPVLKWILDIDDKVIVERLIGPCKKATEPDE